MVAGQRNGEGWGWGGGLSDFVPDVGGGGRLNIFPRGRSTGLCLGYKSARHGDL